MRLNISRATCPSSSHFAGYACGLHRSTTICCPASSPVLQSRQQRHHPGHGRHHHTRLRRWPTRQLPQISGLTARRGGDEATSRGDSNST